MNVLEVTIVSAAPASLLKKLVIVAAAALSSWLVYRLPSSIGGGRNPTEIISVPLDNFDFGEVWEASRFRWTLPMTNNSKRAIQVDGFDASCNCISVDPSSFVLRPGAVTNVELTMDLTSKVDTRPLRDFSVRLSPKPVNPQLPRVAWVLSGKVRKVVTFEPNVVYFGEIIRERFPAETTVEVIHIAQFDDLRVTCDAEFLSVRASPDSPTGKTRLSLLLSDRTKLPIGQFTHHVNLTPVSSHGISYPEQSLLLRGCIQESVQLVPSSLAIGLAKVGESTSHDVVVQSCIDKGFQVDGIDYDEKSIRVLPLATESAQSKQYRVFQLAIGPGAQTGKIVFKIRTQDGRKMSLELPYSYYATN